MSSGRFSGVVHGTWETGSSVPVAPVAAVVLAAVLVSWLATLLWVLAAMLGAVLVAASGGLVMIRRYNRRETGRFIARMGALGDPAQPAIALAAATPAVVNHYHLHLAPGETAEGLDWAIPQRDAITTTKGGQQRAATTTQAPAPSSASRPEASSSAAVSPSARTRSLSATSSPPTTRQTTRTTSHDAGSSRPAVGDGLIRLRQRAPRAATSKENGNVNGNAKRTDVPQTVTDEQWTAMQRRAIAANPRLDDITDPEAIRRNKAAGAQHDKRHQS